jgi:outer membrane protein
VVRGLSAHCHSHAEGAKRAAQCQAGYATAQMPTRQFPLLRMAGSLALLFSGAAAQASFLDGLDDLGSSAFTWEGAIGLVGSYAPAYLGASDYKVGLRPAVFLRYGRFTLTTGAGFTTARADQVERGLGADLVLTDRVKVTLAARVDGGRNASSSPALAGMGDVDATIRARLSATWRPEPGWLLNAAASIDALGRGEGIAGEVSFAREVPVAAKTYWTWGGSLSLGDQTYMQTWYGVTPAQATSSGYPVYTPSAGLRSIALSTGIRSDFVQDWVGFVNLGVSQALGPVLDSPLTVKPFGWGLNAGLAWRF